MKDLLVYASRAAFGNFGCKTICAISKRRGEGVPTNRKENGLPSAELEAVESLKLHHHPQNIRAFNI